MKLDAKTVLKVSNYLLLSLISLEVLFVCIYLGRIGIAGKSYPLFDLDGLQTVPSMFAAVQLLFLGLACIGLSLYKNHPSQKPSRRLLLTLGIFFTYISVDEVFKLHQGFYKPLCALPWLKDCEKFSHIWIQIYIIIALVTIFSLRRDLISSWRFYRRGTALAGIGIFTLLFGGMGLEIIKYDLLQPALLKFLSYSDWSFILVEKIRIAIEEFLEMLGVSVTVYSLGLFLAKRLSKDAGETEYSSSHLS